MTVATYPVEDRAMCTAPDGVQDALPESGSSSHKPTLPLGQLLLEAGLITEGELEAALSYHRRKKKALGEALLELGLVGEDQLLPFLHRQLGIPAVQLRNGLVDPATVRLLPRHVSERLHVLPMFKVRDTLCVAMAEPQSLPRVDEIEEITGLWVRPVFACRAAIQRLIARCYEEDFEVDAVTADLADTAVEVQTETTETDVTSLEEMADGSPVVNLINYLVLQGLRQHASDIHVEPGAKHTTVRFRVDGQLREILRPRRDVHAAMISRVKVMGKMDIAEQRLPQDGRCRVSVEGRHVDLRLSTIPTVLGEKLVIRILDQDRLTFNLDHLGFPKGLLTQFKQLLGRPYGLFLVCGPTGSGKTTTLYSAIELIKSERCNIVTVEDPVEYRVELVNQIQVNAAQSLTFPLALRSILRQDPDVIMVGEIRDSETAHIAVQAALTGHLVLSTVHTNDSAGAVTRFIDMGVEPYKVAGSLLGVVAQRLVRTVCRKCQSIYYPPAEVLKMLKCPGGASRSYVRGEGCRECHDTGFQGRKGIYELLAVDEHVRRLVARDPDPSAIREYFMASGGRTLLQEGVRLAEEHVTSLDEVMRVAFTN
ncbi:MAG: GspE/PulE family protein [Planctomycetota bacterium]